MIAAVIRASLRNRLLVILAALMMASWGWWAVQRAPLDALPDLSDVQVIIKASYPGKAPQVIEDQVTWPLTTSMLSVPGAKTVRGFSMFGDAYVYVLFEDGTDLYWARSRVLEYLSQVQAQFPPGVKVSLGPDATGVGWIYGPFRTGRLSSSLRRYRMYLKWQALAEWCVSIRSWRTRRKCAR